MGFGGDETREEARSRSGQLLFPVSCRFLHLQLSFIAAPLLLSPPLLSFSSCRSSCPSPRRRDGPRVQSPHNLTCHQGTDNTQYHRRGATPSREEKPPGTTDRPPILLSNPFVSNPFSGLPHLPQRKIINHDSEPTIPQPFHIH